MNWRGTRCVDDKHSVVNGAIEKESRPNSPYHEESLLENQPQTKVLLIFYFISFKKNTTTKELKWNKI